MKNTIITLLLLFVASLVYAQEYGDISTYEISLEEYEKDKEASGVVLFDKGKSYFFENRLGGYDIRFTRHRRVKVFDNKKFNYSEVSIPYYVDGYGETEFVKSIKATTYDYRNGKLIKKDLDLATVNDEVLRERWRVKKFRFPKVRSGSIIEYEYVLETPFQVNLPDWVFQSRIPTIRSEYEVAMIPFYEYVFFVQGISKFDERDARVDREKRTWGNVSKRYGENIAKGMEFQDVVHTFVMKDLPAFKDEAYITSVQDYIIKMDFQLAKYYPPMGVKEEILSTWSKLNKALLKHRHFGKYKKQCNKYAKNVLGKELNLEGLDARQKTIKIIDYVKDNYEWTGFYAKYASQTAKEFYKSKKGNSADLNLFMWAIFEKTGIQATPVILSTRGFGKIKHEFPFDHSTNSVVIHVDEGQAFLADATDRLISHNKLPINYLNEKGLFVTKEDEGKWMMMNNNKVPSVSQYKMNIQVNPKDSKVQVDVNIDVSDYEAYHFRKHFKDDKDELRKHFSESFRSVKDIKTEHFDDIDKPYSISFNGEVGLYLNKEILHVSPYNFLGLTENKLTQKERKYPVDLIYSQATKFSINVDIPTGYAIDTIPANYSVNNDLVMIKTDYTTSEDQISIEANYYFKKAIYMPNEYARLKSYMDRIIKEFNKKIVFRKL